MMKRTRKKTAIRLSIDQTKIGRNKAAILFAQLRAAASWFTKKSGPAEAGPHTT
jgi:hypothetical protein